MQEQSRTKRVEWIDVLKFICIFFVIHHHTDASYGVNVTMGYFPFFLIGFFFASGYVYKRAPFKEFIKKKLLGILLPWGIFAVVVPLIKNLITGGDVLGVLLGDVLQIRSYGDSLWFLAALFVAFIPFYFIEKYLPPLKGIILSAVLATISIFYVKFCPAINYNILSFSAKTNFLPWHIETVFVAQLFMIAGRYYKGKPEELTKKFIKPWIWIIVFAAYLAIVIAYYSVTSGILGLDSYGGKDVYSFFIWIAAVSLGLISLVMFSKLIKPNKFILYVGANTLIYYVLHIEVANFILHLPTRILNGWEMGDSYTTLSIISDYFLDRVFSDNYTVYSILWNISYFIVFISNALLTMAVLIVPSYLINNFAPFLMGKKYPLKTKIYARRIIKKISGKDVINMKDEILYAESKMKDLCDRKKIKTAVIMPSDKENEDEANKILAYAGELNLSATILTSFTDELYKEDTSDDKISGSEKTTDAVEIIKNYPGYFKTENTPSQKFILAVKTLSDADADCIVAIGKKAERSAKTFASIKKSEKKTIIISIAL